MSRARLRVHIDTKHYPTGGGRLEGHWKGLGERMWVFKKAGKIVGKDSNTHRRTEQIFLKCSQTFAPRAATITSQPFRDQPLSVTRVRHTILSTERSAAC